MFRLERSIFRVIALLLAVVVVSSCSRLPSNVLDKEEMASLLLDIHMGEGLVDLQRSSFYNDSMRKVLKQSIYAKHGVTAEQVDTSFVWYGNHIEDYIEIYDNVIAQLEEDARRAERSAKQTVVYAAGDSIDVWTLSPTYRINSDLPSKFITFKYDKDDNWQAGDNYTLQLKLLNHRDGDAKASTILVAEYDDGEIEFRNSSAEKAGWIKIRLVTDSTRIPESIYGSITFEPAYGEVIFADSVALVRTRNIPATYNQRGQQRRLFRNKQGITNDDNSSKPDFSNVQLRRFDR